MQPNIYEHNRNKSNIIQHEESKRREEQMRIGVILASHGEFARATLGAVEMIAGEQSDVIALGLTAEKSLETFEAEMREAYASLKANCDLVVALCDIYGGTPFNVTTRCLLNGMDMVAYTGLSMPVAVELLLTRDGLDSADAVRAQLTSAHAAAQMEICAPAPAASDDEDDLDL